MAKKIYCRIKDHTGKEFTVTKGEYLKMKDKPDVDVTLKKEIKDDFVVVKSKSTGQESLIPTHLLLDLERNGDVDFVEEKSKVKAKKKTDT